MNYKLKIFIPLLFILYIPFFLISYKQLIDSIDYLENKQENILEIKKDHVKKQLVDFEKEIMNYALLASTNEDLQFAVFNLKSEEQWDPEDASNINNYPSDTFTDVSTDHYDENITQLRQISNDMFNILHASSQYVGNIEIMNSKLVVVMRGHRDKRGDTKSDKIIFDAVNGMASSGYLVSKRVGMPAIDGTAPIIYKDQIVGGIKIGMYITGDVMAYIGQQESVEFLMFDKDRLVDIETINNDTIELADNLSKNNFDILDTTDDTKAPVIKDDIFKDFIMNNKTYTELYSSNDTGSYAVSLVPFLDYSKNVIGAYLIALDNSDMISEINKAKRDFYADIFILFILGVLLSYAFSHQIGNPLINFKNQLSQMKRDNDLRPLTNLNGPSELLDVAFEFNSLIDQLVVQKRYNYELIEITHTDGLTNLYNHMKFYEDLDVALKSAAEISLIFLDLDCFKQINDSLGHSVGDRILRVVSDIIRSHQQEEIITGYRYGGEEFSILLKEHNGTNAYGVAEKIRVEIEASEKLKSYANDFNVTVSTGVATFPTDASNGGELVECADAAMYYSKNNGRNRSSIYSSAINRSAEKRKKRVLNYKGGYAKIKDIESDVLNRPGHQHRYTHPSGPKSDDDTVVTQDS